MARELKGEALRVHNIMEKNESARNNDWSLIAHYMNRYYAGLIHTDGTGKFAYLKDLKKFPSAETLIRARRIIQNDLELLPPTDPKVRKARGIKEQNYTNAEVREAKQLVIT